MLAVSPSISGTEGDCGLVLAVSPRQGWREIVCGFRVPPVRDGWMRVPPSGMEGDCGFRVPPAGMEGGCWRVPRQGWMDARPPGRDGGRLLARPPSGMEGILYLSFNGDKITRWSSNLVHRVVEKSSKTQKNR